MPTFYPQENSTSLSKVETAVKKPLNIDWTPVVPLSKVQIPSSKAPAAYQRDSLPSEEAEGDWTLYCRGPALHKAVQEELKQNPVEKYVDMEENDGCDLDKFVTRDGCTYLEVESSHRKRFPELQLVYENSVDEYCEIVAHKMENKALGCFGRTVNFIAETG